jgi:hypothetical protein
MNHSRFGGCYEIDMPWLECVYKEGFEPLYIIVTVSLSAQRRQVYCLVEMAPSAPSRRPPRHRDEFDGFSGRRERPNQCRHTTIASGHSTYPTLRRDCRRKISPSDPSLNQPSRQSLAACPKRPNSSRTFINLNNSLNLERKNDRTTELILHRPLESSIKTLLKNYELNCTESELSKSETVNGLLGSDIATDHTKTFNTEESPRKVFRSNHRRRVAPSDPSLIKPSRFGGCYEIDMPWLECVYKEGFEPLYFPANEKLFQ